MRDNNSKEEGAAKTEDVPHAKDKQDGGSQPLKPATCDSATQTEPCEEGYDMRTLRSSRNVFSRQLYSTAQDGERAVIEEGRVQRCKICCSMCLVNMYYVMIHR